MKIHVVLGVTVSISGSIQTYFGLCSRHSLSFATANKCDGKPIYCDCRDCTEQYWNTEVNTFTCGERIRSLQGQQYLGLNENAACKAVSEEYPGESFCPLFQLITC